MPLQYQPSQKRLGSSGWGLTGPIIAAEIRADERAAALEQIVRHVHAIAATCGAELVELGHVAVTGTGVAEDGRNPFVELGFADESTTTRVVDLQRSEQELLAGLSKNARQMIRRAEQLGYSTRLGEWPSSLNDYYRVHSETYTRTGVSPHPREYFEGIAREMAPRGHARLWVGVDPGGRDVAFHNDACFGPGTLYHTGCSESAHLDSGINYLLMWRAILGARESGCRYYEVGEVFPDATEGKTRGLTVFKSKFGGEDRRYVKARRRVTASGEQPVAATVDAQVRNAYERGTLYDTSRICRQVQHDAAEYVDRLLADKLAMVADAYQGGTLVDLCCASGVHAIDLAAQAERVVGIDFTARYVESGRDQAAAAGRTNVAFLQADARQLPLAAGTTATLYCFSSLYAIPRAAEVIAEVGRALRPGGRAVLDFGNSRSLNVFCLRYYTDWPSPHPMSLADIRRALAAAGLIEERRRCFQLLPLWAGRPSWLWPLLHPMWKSLLKRRVAGKMLDEWISSLPGVRAFAFRHVIVCRKPGVGDAAGRH